MPANKDNKLFRKVLWFSDRQKFDIDFFDLLQPCRTVSQDPRYRSGVYHSEKCGREIQYESALELHFIEWLERHPGVAFYWDQPIRISYRRGRRRQCYTPDFAIYLKSGEVVIAEVKELAGMLDYRVQLKTEALMEFCSSRGFGLLLTDGRHTPAALLRGKVNRSLEKAILTALQTHAIRREECRDIMSACGATQAELYRAVIRLNLKFRPFPLKIQRENDNVIFRQVFFGKKKYDDLVGERFPALFKKEGAA